MKTVAIIQARMGSTRLPGKVMMRLGTWLQGAPVIHWVINAARSAVGVDEVIVATTVEPSDDLLAEYCGQRQGTTVFRGSETDVLSRYVGAAQMAQADVVLRLTGDCPFLDPRVISEVVRLRAQTGAAYCSNIHPRTYPDGLDVECFTYEALMAAHEEADRAIDRDTVTQWIVRNRSRFPAQAVINPIPGLQNERWVLDTEDDLKFCQEIAGRWGWMLPAPSHLDILAILDKEPELRDINRHHVMNERFFDALADEPLYPRTYGRSQRHLARALDTIPLAAQTFSKSHVQFPQPSPLFVSHGQGGLVWDIDGNEYVDLVSALLPNILGYRDPDVDAAIRHQLSAGISFSLATELEAQLSETLCRIIPCAEMVRFGKTGTDVTSAAVRLARAVTGRDHVLVCGGYHGWQDWSIERNLGVPDDVRRLTERVPFGDQDAARAAFDRQTVRLGDPTQSWGDLLELESRLKRGWIAAVIVEPEQDADYLGHLRWLCSRYGALLIFDEVITGFRWSLGGAQEYFGVTPDLACFGKAMANGMPLSALVGKREFMKRMAPGDEPNIFYSGTMFGETLSIAASIATIDKLERDEQIALGTIWGTGSSLANRVEWYIETNGLDDVIELYGHPPLKRLRFRDDKIAALFRKEMISTGTLIIASHNICLAHSKSDLARIEKSYDHTLGVIADAIRKDDIDKRLQGASVMPLVRAS